MATYSNILAGESHGHRSLADYSPWGHTVGEDVNNYPTTGGNENNHNTCHATHRRAGNATLSL